MTAVEKQKAYKAFTFRMMKGCCEHSLRCPMCGGEIVDDSDPLASQETHEAYKCRSCGLYASKTRQMSEELRTALALRYSCSGEAPLPDPVYEAVIPAKGGTNGIE